MANTNTRESVKKSTQRKLKCMPINLQYSNKMQHLKVAQMSPVTSSVAVTTMAKDNFVGNIQLHAPEIKDKT